MRRAYLLAFALGTALAGAAGTLVSVGYSISPSIGLEWTLKALIVVVLAGLGLDARHLRGRPLRGRGRGAQRGRLRRAVPRGGGARASSSSCSCCGRRACSGAPDERLREEAKRARSPPQRAQNEKSRSAPPKPSDRRALAARPPRAASPPRPRDDVLNFVFLVLLSITLAQSWNIIAGYAGQVNLGHAAFFGLGALTARTLWIGGTPVLIAMAAGALVADRLRAADRRGRLPPARAPTSRSARWRSARSCATTVGNVLPEISTLPAASIGAYRLAPRYYLALALAALSVLAVAGLPRSRLGLGMQAVREDEDAAEATGVSALALKLRALALSTALAGAGGRALRLLPHQLLPVAPVQARLDVRRAADDLHRRRRARCTARCWARCSTCS